MADMKREIFLFEKGQIYRQMADMKREIFLFEKGQIYRRLYGWVATLATQPYKRLYML